MDVNIKKFIAQNNSIQFEKVIHGQKHTLNIGILAHVDAGKTSLTERLLLNSGVIKSLGSVEEGNTQTDSMDLERKRGITIRSAVVSFNIGSLKINLIDTPGHPDFIAEVERALGVLDAVILVISAVEGIQPQTRILMRTLKKLHIPTIIFINKIDRMGACSEELVAEIQDKLFPNIVQMNSVKAIGTKEAEVVGLTHVTTNHNDLVAQINQMQVCPILFGSAITGSGVSSLIQALETYFSTSKPKLDDEPSAIIFKIERGQKDEKIAYIRIYSGIIHSRSHIELHRKDSNGTEITYTVKITDMKLFQNGGLEEVSTAQSGDIVKVWGLGESLINDYIGKAIKESTAYFSRPSLEVVLKPESFEDRSNLYRALQRISEQDPLIQIRQSENGVLSIRLYGEVQKEIIEALLHDEYNLEVHFEKEQIIYIEKPKSTGNSYASKRDKNNIFAVTLGLTLEPTSINSGVVFKPGPGIGGLPTAFIKAVEDTVYKTLQQGLYGWEVTDCIIEVIDVGYWDATSTGGDFRGLTPLLLLEALQKAGTEVYEPLNHFELDIPESLLGPILKTLTMVGARIANITTENAINHINGSIPVGQTFDFERSVPNLTQGEGVFITEPGGYQKVEGAVPSKPRMDNNPLNKEEYLRRTLKRS